VTRLAAPGEPGPGRGTPAARRRSRAAALAAAVVLAVAGCSRGAPAPDAAAVQARSQRLVEAGNQAYQAGDYRLAARRYAAAAVVKRDDPAAYFGMGMALSKLGRDEEARAAYARSRELSRTRAVLDWKGTHGRSSAPAETIRANP